MVMFKQAIFAPESNIPVAVNYPFLKLCIPEVHMTHSQMLGKVESGRGPIFKVVLEC